MIGAESFPELGIIPAYAGNTLEACGPVVFAGDHPRICGEHLGEGLFLLFGVGSSPHMRGTPP